MKKIVLVGLIALVFFSGCTDSDSAIPLGPNFCSASSDCFAVTYLESVNPPKETVTCVSNEAWEFGGSKLPFITINPERKCECVKLDEPQYFGLKDKQCQLVAENNATPKTIKMSEMQGDYVYDTRTPGEVCDSLLQEVQDSNPNLNCRVVVEKRIDFVDVDYQNVLEEECVDGYSIAGCYSCTFECK